MALGGALGPAWAPVTPRHFAWQAWHNLTSTVVLRGRRETDGTGWRAWTGLGACDAAALCVAGVAQPDIHLRFTWQAWHNVTSTVVLRGRRGADGIGWRAWTGLGACDAAALCVAGVAQPDIHLRFTWQAWHKLTSNSHPPSFCVAGVRQMALLPACFVFQRASACSVLALACLSAFFCRTATCFDMFDFGMFKCGPLHTKMRSFRHVSFFFPRASACLILACLILACLITFFCRPVAFHTHTHTSGQVRG